jgi:hypothetical protein
MLIAQPQVNNSFFDNPAIKNTFAIILILFFGPIGMYFLIKKLNDKRPGLIINETGIYDGLSGVAAGQVLWGDIIEVKITSVFNEKFLLLIVKNPEDYIRRETNMVKRKVMQINHNRNGSPITIPASLIDFKLTDLKITIENRLNKFKNQSN